MGKALPLSLFLLAVAAASGALASPVEQRGLSVTFAPSCAACAADTFCEYGYPGTPADSIACVAGGSLRQLYRRYDTGNECPDVEQDELTYFPVGSQLCPAGAQSAQACDTSTGSFATGSSASGTCQENGAGHVCCAVGSALAAVCEGWQPDSKLCVTSVGGGLAVNPVGITEAMQCDFGTGVVGSGTGVCFIGSADPVAGYIAGCCQTSGGQ